MTSISTSIIHFTPISGTTPETPPCYLLQIDEFTFLLDCGWNESFEENNYIEKLRPHLANIDAVLLSHPDIEHLGALPHLVGKCGLDCPIYATIPVYQMGQMFTYDLYQSHQNYEEFGFYNLDDVDAAFDRVIQLKHNQSVTLVGKGTGMTITPLPAGHMIGSAIWRIVKDDSEEFIYATDFNHKKERHLNGCILADKDCPIRQPALFITDCLNVAYKPEQRKVRDERLFKALRGTLKAGGNVLLPVDTAGRVLEMAQLLEQTWRSDRSVQAYSVVLLNVVAYNVIEFAKSLLEFMSEKLMKTFEGARSNPFQFRYIQFCHNPAELPRYPEPRVVLATQPDLESGFAREMLFDFSRREENLILFTSRTLPGSLAHRLMMLKREEADGNNEKPWIVQLDRKMRVALVDKELEEYLELKREEEEKQREAEAEERKAKGEDIEEGGEDGDEDSDEDDGNFFINQQADGEVDIEVNESAVEEGVQPDETLADTKEPKKTPISKRRSSEVGAVTIATPGSQLVRHDLMLTRSDAGGRIKGGGFFKAVKRTYPMYPFIERKMKWDEYGEFINPDDYVIFDMSRMMMAASAATAVIDDKENHTVENGFADLNESNEIGGKDSASGEENRSASVAFQETPTKCIVVGQELAIECDVGFIDFEGRTDGVGMMMVLQNIKPRRLILVRGGREQRSDFRGSCIASRYFDDDKVYVPEVLETVDATTERHIYKVKLTDALASSLQFAPGRNGVELAWVDAEIEMERPETQEEAAADETKGIKVIAHKSRQEGMPALKMLPLAKLPPHETIFVNELRLSDFKPILMANGIQAEFSGGVLVCNGRVEVRRNEGGRIHLEGTVCEDYFRVRQLLYQQYAIL